ncbi:MAG: tetratricopeptide repeat protein [Betaproteobacteria bacterium]|nr:tetratricopeptide repeat protein [Betaproteobacteria bacterium]
MLTRFARITTALLLSMSLGLVFSVPARAQDLQDINRLIKQGQHAQALDKLNAYLTGKPKDPLARFLKGVVLTEQGKTNEAISLFQALTEEYPELPEPYNNLAVLYATKGQFEKAKVSLEMAIQTHPSYATAHENLGDIYAKMASAAYDKALQLDKSNKSAETKLSLIRDMFPANGKRDGARGAPVKEARKSPASASAPISVASATPDAATPAAVASTAAPAASAPASVAPVSAPAAIPAKPLAGANESEAVLTAVMSWAKAWSGRDLEAYLGSYVADYHPPGETHDAWKSSRRDRILAPKRISVEILNPKVTMVDATHAKVSFKQDYKSDRLSTSSSKSLALEKQGGQWRISREQSGK